jgi:hypothetical protein
MVVCLDLRKGNMNQRNEWKSDGTKTRTTAEENWAKKPTRTIALAQDLSTENEYDEVQPGCGLWTIEINERSPGRAQDDLPVQARADKITKIKTKASRTLKRSTSTGIGYTPTRTSGANKNLRRQQAPEKPCSPKSSEKIREQKQHKIRCKIKSFYWKSHRILTTIELTVLPPSYDYWKLNDFMAHTLI